MGLSCPLIGGAGTIAAEHGPRAPARQSHQVTPLTALREPLVSECMPEQMRVHMTDTRRLGSVMHQLVDPTGRERLLPSQPQLRLVRVPMGRSCPEVAVQHLGGFLAEWA